MKTVRCLPKDRHKKAEDAALNGPEPSKGASRHPEFLCESHNRGETTRFRAIPPAESAEQAPYPSENPSSTAASPKQPSSSHS